MGERERWCAAAVAELDLPPQVLAAVADPVLDLVREVAHGVDRPSAPLTAFLVGLSAGSAVGSVASTDADVLVAAVLERVALARSAAAGWEREG